MPHTTNPLGARATLALAHGSVAYYQLRALAGHGVSGIDRLPFTVKVLLENLLRNSGGGLISDDDVLRLARWTPGSDQSQEFPFFPARVVLQDFTGVPAVVDLAAMRDALSRMGGNPKLINPMVPADLVIDHSVQVDLFGSNLAFVGNVEREYERNSERYALLRWAQKAFQNFSVVPPGTGIVHQVNLEYLSKVVQTRDDQGQRVAYPDTLVGTDSHTTMVNGLGVLGWGVGGIEAEAVLLGQPLYQLTPEVVGLRFSGKMREGTTATDLVLTVTQLLRKHGVVEKFVEYTGPGLSHLSVADRATLANMAPEYGATAGLFPVDDETLRYMRVTGRSAELVDLVERYCKEQGLFRTDATPDPAFSTMLELDLDTIEPSLAGPRRPQDRVPLSKVQDGFWAAFSDRISRPESNGNARGNGIASGRFDQEGGHVQGDQSLSTPAGPIDPQSSKTVEVAVTGEKVPVRNGSVVIAAITRCTNTSNPTVMVGAGLVAKKAVERGLMVHPSVKTSFAPGSKAVSTYLEGAGLMSYLEALRFHLVGYGCTTCIGNSGPLPEAVEAAVRNEELVVAAVLSGNRNFEARIHPLVRASYLASPPLVVAYALAGTVDIDLNVDPIGQDPNGANVYLRDIWPSMDEVNEVVGRSVKGDLFTKAYADVFAGDERWLALPVPEGDLYAWSDDSTYVHEPPFFRDMTAEPPALRDITGARVLVVMGDSVTTDHISPAGSIAKAGPAGQFLIEKGVQPLDFNSFGSRRGNDEVMARGTFGNVRLRNALTPEKEGDWTLHLPDGEEMRIYDASVRYRQEGTPLIVIAGKEYGTGSSRDWAAKGPMLLGVRAAIAESFERIHRSNLVGMGILPLQFKPGENRASLGLTGKETFDIAGIKDGVKPGQEITVRATREDGSQRTFQVRARIDSPIDVEYYRHGGILPMVLRRLAKEGA